MPPILAFMQIMAAALLLALVVGGFVPAARAADPSPGTAYAQRMADLVNAYRVRHGLRALYVDATLSLLALEHSRAMAMAGRMSHDDFPSRARRSGLALCVENVGWNYRSPDAQVDGWRASPGHDRNLLDRRVERMGIGVASDYVTLIACGK